MSNKVTLFSAIKEALQDPNLAKADCSVYVILLDRSREGKTRTSQARISAMTGLHEVSVNRSIRKLESHGYVRIERIGANQTNIYHLLKLLDGSNHLVASKQSNRPNHMAGTTDQTKWLPDSIEARLGEKSKAQTKGLHVPKHRPKTKPSALHGAGSLQQTTR